MQTALALLRANGGGALVHVRSVTSLSALPGLGGYPATESALNKLSQIARIDLAECGISVAAGYPSITFTQFHQQLRAGHLVTGPWSVAAAPPELVATAIIFAAIRRRARARRRSALGDPTRGEVRAHTAIRARTRDRGGGLRQIETAQRPVRV